MSDDLSTSRISPFFSQQSAQAQKILTHALMQEESEIDFTEWAETAAFNPLAMARRFETLEIKVKKKGKDEETEKAERKDKKILEVKKLEEVAEQFQKKNPEIQSRTLLLLRARISNSDTKEDILKKVLEIYPDFSLADEALDYLIETTDGDLALLVAEAKKELNDRYGREIRAGKNIASQAREFSSQGLGSPSGLRNMYRDITGNPRDATTLFDELSAKFPFDKMTSVIDFLLHSLGNDLKARGPSIARAELHRLMTETRSLQAIIGLYRFFKSRMRLIRGSFRKGGFLLPSSLTFELIAKQFIKFIQERYPSSEKALQLAAKMGILEELEAQIILYTQMRDAVRGVAPKLFKSEQHRQDVLMAFIEALEELDEQLEDEEGKKEKEKKKKGE